MVLEPKFFSFRILSWYRYPKACSGIVIFSFIFYCLFVVVVVVVVDTLN